MLIFTIFVFLENTNLASPYLKACFTVKIWLNLMNKKLISRLIQATIPVPGDVGWGWYWVQQKQKFTKNVQYDFSF